MFYQLEHIGTVGYFKKEEGENFNYSLHLHQSFELIYLDEGKMTVTVNGISYELQQGEALLIFPNQIHSIHSTTSRHTLFIFSPHLIQSFYVEKNGKLPKNNRLVLSNDCARLIKGLSQQSSKYRIKGVLYLVCELFDKYSEYTDCALNKENALGKILLFIENNFKNACTVCDIAKGTSYNVEYISRIFKKYTGISCKEYITARRLSYATYLLTKTEETCLFCALESGFTSLRSFNRNFKKYLKVSPLEYKKYQHKEP